MNENNSVWFVTGGSKGIGLELVRRLLAEGHRVAVTSRSEAALVAAFGPKSAQLLPLAVDLVDEKSVAQAVAATVAHFGSLDVVVNNAGYGQFGALEELTGDEVRKNFDINVFGLLNVLRATLPVLRQKRAGHVFNIASIGGFVGNFPGWGGYCATKFAVAGLTEALHAELAEHGVHVTLVYPGYFRTDFLAEGSLALPSHPIAAYTAARASEEAHKTALNHQQPGDPAKLANLMLATAAQANPPLHLFAGKDAVKLAEEKLVALGSEIDRHRAASTATDLAQT